MDRHDRQRGGGRAAPRFVMLLALALALALTSVGGCGSSGDDEDAPVGDAAMPAEDAGAADAGGCLLVCEDDETLLEDCSCARIGARMRLTTVRERDGFYDMPWPHDLRRLSDGALDLGDFPYPAGVQLLDDNLSLLSSVSFGFGTTAPIYLGFDDPLDPGSLPVDAAATLEEDAGVFLAVIDPASDSFGERVPLSLHYVEQATAYIDSDVLVALPYPGFPLRPDTLYGLYLTDAVRGADGEAVQASGLWRAVREGSTGDEDVAALAESYAPLFEAAGMLGLDPEHIVGGTVYRTLDPTEQLRALARHAQSLPAPSVASIATDDRLPDDAAEDGNFTLLTGYFEAPVYQQGDPPYTAGGGDIRFDADGEPVVARMELLRFALTVPQGSMPAEGWPVALYDHGTGGDAFSFHRDGTAFHVAAAGVAMIAVDAPLHGERNPTTDDPTLLFFNIQNLLALRDNLRQSAVDLVVLQRLVQGFDVGAAESPTGEAIRFDGSRLFAMGHSQGALSVSLMLAVTDGVRGAMLSGAGGSVASTIATKLLPFSVPALARATLRLEDDEALDLFHPALAMVALFGETSDPINFVPYYYRWGDQGLHLWLTSGLDDEWVPPEVTNAVATAAGVSPLAPLTDAVEGLELRGNAALPAPVRQNVTAADGERYTGVLSQYPDQGHFLIQNDPGAEAQLTHWFEGLVSGTPELIAP